MTKRIRLWGIPLALMVVASACQKTGDAPPESRQVELAPAPPAQPQLADTAPAVSSPTADLKAGAAPAPAKVAEAKAPPKPAPRTAATPVAASPAPAPAPVPAAPTTGTIGSGAALSVTTAARVCTNTHRVGDRVTATLSSAVTGTNSAEIPAGAIVTLRVTESVRGENGKEGVRLAFEPVSVTYGGESYEIAGSVRVAHLETVRSQTTGDQAKKVAAGAAVGAIAGQLLGKKTKSTVVGAAVGAAAGGAIAAGTADWNGCVAERGAVTVTLAGPVVVKLDK
ncbi:MAG: hypothetical protein FJ363_03295 [Gemmatimonadetes bacterium]|nr:hypothetical protein [Gemmatimonadota bacterium]